MNENNVQINNYKIFLNIDTDNLKLNGNININLYLCEDINFFEINCKDINIKSLNINSKIYNWEEDKDKEIIKIVGQFSKSKYNISIEFYYLINDEMDGLYYTKKNNDLILCTHLEPTSARKFIPCFDFPNLKATFDLKIQCDENMFAISNNSVKNICKNVNTRKKIIEFNTTPKMSTYLLCIVLGNIVPTLEIPLYTENGTKVNGYSISSDKKFMEWSIKHTVKAINYFTKWFGIQYPLDKLDIVSIPNFIAGAMENWGIVTFREEFILLYKKSDSLAKVKILEVIYHEIAHQWFGNLVTLNTWNDLWLNESTATYFSWMALKDNYPKYYISELYYLMECKSLVQIDGISNTHPIIFDSNESSNPTELFDEITYAKGSTIIYYISNLLGINSFKNSIKEYLKNNLYMNPSSYELYKNFNEFSINKKINYINLMDNLVKTKGFPILYIKYDNNKYLIRMFTFNLNKNKLAEYPFNLFFKIKIINSNLIETIELINNNLTTINLDKSINILNPDNQLFCICNYENCQPNYEYMSQTELIKYIHDEFTLSIYGYKTFDNYLNIINNILKLINMEINNLLLFTIIVDLNKLFQIYNNSNINPKNLISFLKQNMYDKIIEFLKIFLIKSPIFFEMIVDQIFILGSIVLNNLELTKIIKNIYDNQNYHDYFIKSKFKIIMKYYQFEEFDQIIKILNNSTNVNNIINIIESFNYLSDKNFEYIFCNYKKIINSQHYSLFFSSISKIYSKQEFIIDYWINNRDKISSLTEIQFKILNNISINIFDIQLINKIIKYINTIIINTNKLILSKIIDLLESNILIYNILF